MNRPIEFKFVGRNKKFNEIVISEPMTLTDIQSGNYLSFFALSNRIPEGNCDFRAEIQYTGMTDKNGKKVFEGDIVRIKGYQATGQVFFYDAGFWIEEIGTCVDGNKLWSLFMADEILGNIFENPELLEGK